MRTVHCLSLAWLLVAGPASLPQQPPDFLRAAPLIERKLKDSQPDYRLEALQELRKYPQPRAARMCLLVARDPHPRVRHHALETLAQLQKEPAVRDWMARTVLADLTDNNAILALALLASLDEPADWIASLDKLFKTAPARLIPLVLACEDLAGTADSAPVRALHRLTKIDAYPRTLGLQRRVARALIATPRPDAVAGLVGLVPRSDGELRWQITEHLTRISGRHFPDPASWQEWWQKNRDGFRYPEKPVPLVDPRVEDDGPRYFGLPIRARRLVFIIDSSGSMAGPRMVNAQKELIQAVQKLPGSTEFNIVWFNNRVGAWSPRLVSATDDAKRKAAAFVGSLVPAGSTWTYDALQAALNLKEESIYLLTDGQPTGGQLVAPDAIVAAVRRQNLLQGTSIHTIGIDTGSDESPFSRFLKSLAEQNHGQFRKVE